MMSESRSSSSKEISPPSAWRRVNNGLGYGLWERASNVSAASHVESRESLEDTIRCKGKAVYDLEPSGFEAGLLRKSDRKGLFHGADIELPECNGVHFTSACTDGDGACGLHAQYGYPKNGTLSYDRGQLELRQQYVNNLPMTFEELLGAL